jgi:hypothetical protein
MKKAPFPRFVLLIVAVFAIVAFSVYEPASSASERASVRADRDGSANAARRASLSEDQIFNDTGSSSTVSFSTVEGGLSPGSQDNGNNVDVDPLFVDADGEDRIPGTVDDRIEIQTVSPVVNGGDNVAIPADRFDLDGDGNTDEAIPTDLSGAERTFPSPDGGGKIDLGAYENGAGVVSVQRGPEGVELPMEFTVPYPNPVSNTGQLSFRLPETERVTVEIYDVLGRKQASLFSDVAEKNRTYNVNFAVSELSSGAYFIRLSSNSYKKTVDLVVVR